MKQKDILVIVAVAFGSAIVAFIISSKVIATPANRQQTIEVAPSISTEFPQPDPNSFNSNAIDPTQLIQIGNNSNTAPFNSSGN